jgi:hypothetical protein
MKDKSEIGHGKHSAASFTTIFIEITSPLLAIAYWIEEYRLTL